MTMAIFAHGHDFTFTLAVYEGEPDEGGYWAEVLQLPGCVAQGETLDELKTNAVEAIIAWLETDAEILQEQGSDPRVVARQVITMNLPVENPFQDHIPNDGGLIPAS